MWRMTQAAKMKLAHLVMQVETVRPYYQRWLERFPTLSSLAEAP